MEGLAKFLFLALLGGFIALVGDRIGKYFGKKKLTLFHLRPKYTSMIFTFLYGMMISVVTMGILALISGNARIALMGVHALEVKREKLANDIQQLAQLTTVNELVFRIDQPIVMGEIQGKLSVHEIQDKLNSLLQKANEIAVSRYNEAGKAMNMPPLPSNTKLVHAQDVDYNQAVHFLATNKGDFVAIVYALQNTYLREPVFVRFGFLENKLVFHAGQTILQVKINGKERGDRILVDLFKILSELQQAALRAGMIPNPVTNDFGGNVLVATLLDKRDEIKAINGMTEVQVIAQRNLYRIGPLDVRFQVRPLGE
jgi:uncharacterized protein (DUF3084 family)